VAACRVKVPTGLAVAIPEGYVGLIFARSGLATKFGVAPANCVGVIDSDYRGEVIVGLSNHSGEDYVIQPGERIAQLVLMPIVQAGITVVDDLDDTQRGTGGFGSTGRG
jgi:dUTP pyrophosphatase